MKVGKMCMAMAQWRMPMPMRMRLRAFVTEVRMLVVFVVDVSMLVLHGFVLVLMQVTLAQRKPSAGGGQREGRRKRSGHRFAEKSHGQAVTEINAKVHGETPILGIYSEIPIQHNRATVFCITEAKSQPSRDCLNEQELSTSYPQAH